MKAASNFPNTLVALPTASWQWSEDLSLYVGIDNSRLIIIVNHS